MSKCISKINWTWKKITGVILGILGIGTITSCYGMPIRDPYSNPEGQNVVFTGTIKGDINGDGETEEVSGIRVTSNYARTFSGDTGKFEILSYFPEGEDSAYVYFTDIDGTDNGSFEACSIEVPKPVNYNPDSYNEPSIEGESSAYKDGVIDLGEITLTKK